MSKCNPRGFKGPGIRDLVSGVRCQSLNYRVRGFKGLFSKDFIKALSILSTSHIPSLSISNFPAFHLNPWILEPLAPCLWPIGPTARRESFFYLSVDGDDLTIVEIVFTWHYTNWHHNVAYNHSKYKTIYHLTYKFLSNIVFNIDSLLESALNLDSISIL